jgi:hypothetical protein
MDHDYKEEPPPGSNTPQGRESLLNKSLIGEWRVWHGMVVFFLIILAMVLFVNRFGTNPDFIKQQVVDTIGATPQPQGATIVDVESPNRIVVRSIGDQWTVSPIGLNAPKRCIAKEANSFARQMLPKGEKVTLHFDKNIGLKNSSNELTAYILINNHNYNAQALAAGAATANLKQIDEAETGKDIRKGLEEGRQRRSGGWGC